MPFYFTQQQKDELTDALGNRDPDDHNVDFVDIYHLIISFIEDSTDPEVQGIEIFLRGAAQVNADFGSLSQMVRGYTQRQLELRTNDTITEMEVLLQKASNAIAFAIVNDILGNNLNNPNPNGELPSSDEIARYDATSAVLEFFEAHIPDVNDTARDLDVAAGWAGTRRLKSMSHPSALCEADVAFHANHKVIQEPNINQCKRFRNSDRDRSICFAGFSYSTRMVVPEDDGRSVN